MSSNMSRIPVFRKAASIWVGLGASAGLALFAGSPLETTAAPIGDKPPIGVLAPAENSDPQAEWLRFSQASDDKDGKTDNQEESFKTPKKTNENAPETSAAPAPDASVDQIPEKTGPDDSVDNTDVDPETLQSELNPYLNDPLTIGAAEFRRSCASCHGAEALGDGPLARMLTPKPPALTEISKRAGGSFPFETIFKVIDGREHLVAHGSRSMPVWGDSFYKEAAQELAPYADESVLEAIVASRIFGLVYFLQSIQTPDDGGRDEGGKEKEEK